MKTYPKKLLFYPTSPSHIANLNLLALKLADWRLICVISEFAATNSPGIIIAARDSGYERIVFKDPNELESRLPEDASIVMLGAVFEPFSLEVFLWAKLKGIPVVAVEEVAQLSLNDMTINNYDLPLDKLFVASKAEYELFRRVGYDEDMLSISGLLSTERAKETYDKQNIFRKLGLKGDRRILLYTTSPLRNRYAIHNRDDWKFRKEVLTALSTAINDKWQIIIKLHPNEKYELERQRIGEIIQSAMVIGRETDVNELLSISDAVLNRGNSQTVLDAVLKGLPAIIISCGIKTLFHEYGGAFIVEECGDLPIFLQRIESGETAYTEHFAENNSYIPHNGSSSFIAAKLAQLSERSLPLSSDKWEWTVRSLLFLGMMNRLPYLLEKIENKSSLLVAVENAVREQLRNRKIGAAAYWEECLKLAPDWFYPHYELAHIQHANEHWDDCLRHIEAALDKHPPYHSLWHAIPLKILKTSCLRAKGRPYDALDEIRLFETNGILECMPELLIEKARILFELGRKDDASSLLERANGILCVKNPLWPEVDTNLCNQMGKLYSEMGFHEAALSSIKSAVKLNPDETLFTRQMAMICLNKLNIKAFLGNYSKYIYDKYIKKLLRGSTFNKGH